MGHTAVMPFLQERGGHAAHAKHTRLGTGRLHRENGHGFDDLHGDSSWTNAAESAIYDRKTYIYGDLTYAECLFCFAQLVPDSEEEYDSPDSDENLSRLPSRRLSFSTY